MGKTLCDSVLTITRNLQSPLIQRELPANNSQRNKLVFVVLALQKTMNSAVNVIADPLSTGADVDHYVRETYRYNSLRFIYLAVSLGTATLDEAIWLE